MKKILLTLFILSSSLFILKAQGSWSSCTPLPSSPRGYAIGFSIGNYGYMGLGYGAKYYHDFWQFNPSTNSWIRKADFPGLARVCPATFVIGKYAYVVTGQDTNVDYLTECWQYNAVIDKWTQKSNFPGSARAYDVGFAIGGKGYVGTGSDYNTHYCKDFWEYDTGTDSWMRIADFGGIARFSASGFATGAKGYVCFGRDSTGAWHTDIWEYDTNTKVWTKKSNYPGYPWYVTSGFVIGNFIYVGTGQDSVPSISSFINKFWQYNTLSDKWAEEESFPGPSRVACSGFSIKDTGYFGLGLDSVLKYFNTIYRFYPDTTTGINEIMHDKDGIVLYPNPFSTFCNVFLPEYNSNSKTILTLYNIGGSEVKATIKESGDEYIINRDGLQAGVYILSIGLHNKTIYKKLIIIN